MSGAVVLVAACSVLVAAHAAGDAPPAIAVGEMGATSGGPAAADALKNALQRALADRRDVRLAPDPRRARYVVSGSVVQLEQRNVSDGLEVRCAVSLVVANAHGGAVRAFLSGRAGARGVDDPDRLTRAALEAAIRGALRRLGTQLR
jgi:hypothetical protein